MKKVLLTLLSVLALSAQACWLNYLTGYEKAEISGVNYFVSHLGGTKEQPVSYNNKWVSLPLTVWCNITSSAENESNNQVNLAILYYQIQSGTYTSKWYMVKRIENPGWTIDYKSQVKLFGRNVLTLQQIKKDTGRTLKNGDAIILYVYFRTNKGYQSGPFVANGSNTPIVRYDYMLHIPKGFSEYCLMRVVYNGKTTTGR